MSEEKVDISNDKIDTTYVSHEIGSTFSKDKVDEDFYLQEPDIHTRMFYAQRFIETQYEDIKSEKYFQRWNDFIFKSLKINSLNDNGVEYPKWENNNLSMRTGHWLVGVGLVTSEIMGAYLVPNSMSMLGFVPSNILLVVFFFVTIFSGGVIWWVFLLFDSPEYPVKTFADLAYIIGGQPFKQIVIFLQLIAVILSTGTIVIAAAQCAIILRTDRMCWVGLMALIAGLMMCISSIKKLSVIGKYCLVVSFCNYINLFVQLGYIGNDPPNWENAMSLLGVPQGAIETFAIVPGQSLMNRVVSVSNLSFVFAGSIVFPEVISEMKKPWEFWKSMCTAQSFILGIYLIYGNFIYAHQGQFSNVPAVFGVSDENALKGLGFMTFITSFIQGIFYGHIACKIIYKNYIPIFNKSIKLNSKSGMIVWIGVVIITWIAIFVIGAGVPQVGAVSSFTSALTMIPLTFVIPFILHISALYIATNENSIVDYKPFEPVTSHTSLVQFWKNGYSKYWLLSIFYAGLCLASLSLSGMGLWASVEYMKYIFSSTSADSFSCVSPV